MPGFSPFAGTSAAAPHAAGVAALVLEALGSGAATEQVREVLTGTPEQVRDILISTTDGTGFNYESGYGAINAFSAVEEAVNEAPSPTPVPTSTPEPTNPPGNGGGDGGCSIPGATAGGLAGNAVNMLIMFAPAALFGLGALRRRRSR